MIERQPNRPPIPDPQHTSHEDGNGVPGIPPSVHQRAKPPPESAVNKRPLTPEERREKKRKYVRDYKKRNKDKVNDYQRRYRSHDPSIRPNEKLMEHQWRLAEERMAKRREQEANEPSTDLGQREHQQSEAIQIFPSPPENNAL
jgi:hypothetical protein